MESIQGKYLTSLQHRKPTSTEEEDEAAIFARLEKELETALDEVDVVFEANGLARMEKTYADAQVRRENGNTVMEIFANKVVPFSVEATGHAVWEHFVHSMDHIPSRFVYQKQLKVGILSFTFSLALCEDLFMMGSELIFLADAM
ncbi:hypothetical protein P3T76_010537 [Phytophthora citrophthora]|uniref:Uncharacterized protein n=1 Tax=Phytophthora citrophthora TaxID=4793 RepID=A0AAD9LGE6_9STRA|nr:hypothetical protein P3T76_010537 [Phytophthora citrophthora]